MTSNTPLIKHTVTLAGKSDRSRNNFGYPMTTPTSDDISSDFVALSNFITSVNSIVFCISHYEIPLYLTHKWQQMIHLSISLTLSAFSRYSFLWSESSCIQITSTSSYDVLMSSFTADPSWVLSIYFTHFFSFDFLRIVDIIRFSLLLTWKKNSEEKKSNSS